MKLWMAVFAVVSVLGCSDETKDVAQMPKIEDFDQTCMVNSDCGLVPGDPCACGCGPAVNQSDVEAYTSAVQKVECAMVPTDCELCETVAVCVQGMCKTRQSRTIQADEFSTSCDTVADCMLIAEGEVCQLCACPNIAINAAEYAFEVEAPECGNDNAVCNNCPQPDLACVNNVCVATPQ